MSKRFNKVFFGQRKERRFAKLYIANSKRIAKQRKTPKDQSKAKLPHKHCFKNILRQGGNPIKDIWT